MGQLCEHFSKLLIFIHALELELTEAILSNGVQFLSKEKT